MTKIDWVVWLTCYANGKLTTDTRRSEGDPECTTIVPRAWEWWSRWWEGCWRIVLWDDDVKNEVSDNGLAERSGQGNNGWKRYFRLAECQHGGMACYISHLSTSLLINGTALVITVEVMIDICLFWTFHCLSTFTNTDIERESSTWSWRWPTGESRSLRARLKSRVQKVTLSVRQGARHILMK